MLNIMSVVFPFVGKKGFQIPEEKAMEHIGGYFVALDMTARDLQLEAKKNGHPWALSKGWDTSTPAGDFIDKSKIPNPENLQLWLKVNGEMRQNGNTTDMIFHNSKFYLMMEFFTSRWKLQSKVTLYYHISSQG
jgi:acylpyruvate hydrolase